MVISQCSEYSVFIRFSLKVFLLLKNFFAPCLKHVGIGNVKLPMSYVIETLPYMWLEHSQRHSLSSKEKGTNCSLRPKLARRFIHLIKQHQLQDPVNRKRC